MPQEKVHNEKSETKLWITTMNTYVWVGTLTVIVALLVLSYQDLNALSSSFTAVQINSGDSNVFLFSGFLQRVNQIQRVHKQTFFSHRLQQFQCGQIHQGDARFETTRHSLYVSAGKLQ